LTGINEQYKLTNPVEENIYEMSTTKQRKFKIKTLPSNLEEGLKIMQKSTMLKEAFGDHVFNTFVANKKWEIEEYHKAVSKEFDQQVSEYEIERYLPIL
jgi:glutamine synthetase